MPVEYDLPTVSTSHIHVGRQEIYDRDLHVVGFELLFRSHQDAGGATLDNDAATSSVIVNTFAEFGLDTLVLGRLAFFNLTRAFLLDQLPLPMGPEGVVLEVLESIELDEDTITSVRRLASAGYAIALDDFTWRPGVERVLEVARYVKLDVMHGVDHVDELMERCRPFDVQFVAERVETPAVMQECLARDFQLFQGYHLRRPRVMSLQAITPSQANSLQLLGLLSDPEADLDRIDERVRLDASLSYRLLRIANSASAGLTRRVASVREAVLLVGLQRLRAWLVLIALADLAGGDEERQAAVIVRARACELLARQTGVAPDVAFTLGLVHGLAELLGESLESLVARLNLHESVAEALTAPGSDLRRVLDAVLAHEKLDEAALSESGFEPFDLSRTYLDALGWSLQIRGAVTSS